MSLNIVSEIENRVQKLHDVVMGKNAEFWEEKNALVVELTTYLSSTDVRSLSTAKINDAFNQNTFRLLRDPVKLLVSDRYLAFFRSLISFWIILGCRFEVSAGQRNMRVVGSNCHSNARSNEVALARSVSVRFRCYKSTK